MNTVDEIFVTVRELVEKWLWVTETQQPEPNRLDVKLASPGDLVPIVAGLRVKRIGYLSAITGLDPGAETGELELLYHFCTGPAVITLRVRIPRQDPQIASLCEIIPSAEAFEREISEMFGVDVLGLRAPEHLYLPEDWPANVYPLRKDASLQALSPQGEGVSP